MAVEFPSLITSRMFKLALVWLATTAEAAGASSSNPPTSYAPFLKSCLRPSNSQWMDAKSSESKPIGSSSSSSSSINHSFSPALKARGGDGIWGKSDVQEKKQDGQPKSDGAVEEAPEDEEYEFEYENYEADAEDAGGEEDAEYEYYPDENADDVDGEYEYYEEGEKPATPSKFGKVQDINGEFIDSDEETVIEEDVVNNEEDADDAVGFEGKELEGASGRSFWGRGKQSVKRNAEAGDTKKSTNEQSLYQSPDSENAEEKYENEVEDGEEYAEEDDESYLFTTPIPRANKSPRKLQLANRTVQKAIEEYEFEGADEEEYYEEDEYAEDEGADYKNPHDYLHDTPLENTRKAPKASKTSNTSHWWQRRPQMGKHAGQSKSRQQWRPTSSTKASFVSPFVYSGASLPSFSLRSANGRPIYSEWMSSISAAVNAIFQPIGNAIQTITFGTASTMSRWLSMSWSVVRNSFDFLWYGPVDGVTTTGITTREGGLSAILMSSPIVMAMSSILILGMMTVMLRRLWLDLAARDNVGRTNIFRNKKTLRRSDSFDDEEDYDEDPADEPPSVEEELEFLHREFEAVNPSSKDRVTKAITKENRFPWPLPRERGEEKPKSRRGQRQFTIKSIQTWWKERPSQQAIAIIEPDHLRKQQQPLGQDIKRIQKQLAVSEQERAILQQDVQRLQHKLQKSHTDARSIVQQNKWLEKQTSKADQILTKAVEVERRKANEELGRVRESMKGVLERERMLMRGRMSAGSEKFRDNTIGGHNDLDLNKGPSMRRLDGVKIVREIDQSVGENDGASKPWTAL